PAGAARAAEASLQEGAEIVLGPLFAQSVEAAAQVTRAAQVPMIAFSTDLRVAGDGVYLLSFPPELEVARITDFAMLNGFSSFAAMTPENDYGRRVGDALAEEVYARGGALVREEAYQQNPQAMQGPAKRLAQYDERRAALIRERAQLKSMGDNEIAKRAFEALKDRETFGDVEYDAVLLPEQGNLLRALAPLLPYYGVDIRRVKLLGTSLWENPSLLREPALAGGWFAAPDPNLRGAFLGQY
ncbi:MAG: penicillin-binding protein activator, partial [Pseudomonadota bacterium]